MIRKPSRLVVVGGVVGRLTLNVDSLPTKGGEVLAWGMQLQAGGGFVALASATGLGLPAALAGRLGDGPIAQLIRAALDRRGVSLLLEGVTGEQGLSVCAVETDGDRTFISRPGVESTLSEEDLNRLTVRADDAVLVQGFDLLGRDAAEALSRWCLDPEGLGEAMLLFDPGPMVSDIPDAELDRILSRADVVVMDARELVLLTGAEDEDPTASARTLLESMRDEAMVMVRARGAGSWLVRRHALPRHFPCPVHDVIDTSVAGDAFTGAFVAEYARLGAVETAAWHATVAASMTTIPKGAARAASGPSRDELDAALAELAGQP